MTVTMDNFCSYFFVPLLLFGIWCLFEDEDNFCIKLLVLLTLICNVDWSFLSFLDALASLKTMFKNQLVTDVSKILTNTRFKEYYRELQNIAE